SQIRRVRFCSCIYSTHLIVLFFLFFFFFNDTATTEIYTLSLHDALPILKFTPGPSRPQVSAIPPAPVPACPPAEIRRPAARWPEDRKSTRLNSSHVKISYAVFCLKKKKKKTKTIHSITKHTHIPSQT